MNVISNIVRWLLVASVLILGLLVMLVAYVVHMGKIIMQHKGQAVPGDVAPATTLLMQPVIRFDRVQFNDTHKVWINSNKER